MKRVLLLACMVLFLVATTNAQDAPKVEVFGGYSYARIDCCPSPQYSTFHGWHGAFQGNLNNWFGLVGEVSGHYSNPSRPGFSNIDVSKHFYLFGPRLSMRRERAVVFGHGLFGGVRSDFRQTVGSTTTKFTDHVFSMAFGGGVDIVASKRVAFRVAQLDFVLPQFSGRFDKDFRWSAGLVVRLGD